MAARSGRQIQRGNAWVGKLLTVWCLWTEATTCTASILLTATLSAAYQCRNFLVNYLCVQNWNVFYKLQTRLKWSIIISSYECNIMSLHVRLYIFDSGVFRMCCHLYWLSSNFLFIRRGINPERASGPQPQYFDMSCSVAKEARMSLPILSLKIMSGWGAEKGQQCCRLLVTLLLHQKCSVRLKMHQISGWPLVWKTWKTWKCHGIWNMSGKCQGCC